MRNPGTCFIHRMKPNLEHLNILRRRIVRSDVAGWGSLVCLYSEQTRRQLWPRCKTGAGDALTPAGTAALSGAAVGAGKRAQTLSNRPALARSRAVLARCEDRWHSQPVGSASVAPGARGAQTLFVAAASAPASKSVCTTSSCPHSAAAINGVNRVCKQRRVRPILAR